MLRNYLKVTLRSALKNRTYSFINIFGLAVGLAASIMMVLYIRFETSFDQFHTQKDDIYRLVLLDESFTGGGIAKINSPAGPLLKASLPEVEKMTRLIPFGNAVFTRQNDYFQENQGLAVDGDFFDLYDFNLVAGSPPKFDDPRSIVLTRSMAEKYFGKTDPMDHQVLISAGSYEQEPFMVKAVVEDVPPNSHFDFDFLVATTALNRVDLDDWERMQAYTYVLLRKGAIPAKLERQSFDLILANSPEAAEYFGSTDQPRVDYLPYRLQPLNDIYLQSNLFREIGPTGNPQYVYIVSWLAVFIILIAVVNFINLSTAKASTRIKEVGVRKANGAKRSQLISQYLFESVFFSLMALIIAISLVEMFLPYFNLEIGKELTLDFSPLLIWLIAGSVTLGFLAGIYPALYLSHFRVGSILKNNVRFSSRSKLRQILVVFQFTLSLALILSALVIYLQVDFMKTKNLGFEKEKIINVRSGSQLINGKHETLITELLRHPNIQSVSFSGNLPGGGDWGMPFSFEGVAEDQQPVFRALEVDANFIKTFDMTLVEGRDFSPEVASDVTGAFIINQEGAKQLGWQNPVGKSVFSKPLGWEGKVIGVVEDFHFRSLHEKISPAILFMQPEWSSIYSVKVGSGDFEETVAHLQDQFASFDPSMPFAYDFFDETIDRLYQSEEQLQFVVTGFTLLVVLVAAIGLFGLASYSVVVRTKEFGVRKVLGATPASLVGLVSGDFVKLILISFLIAAPLATLVMDSWLENFAYQKMISPLIYPVSLIVVGGLAFLAVLQQALWAARQQPVDSLRSE